MIAMETKISTMKWVREVRISEMGGRQISCAPSPAIPFSLYFYVPENVRHVL